MSIFRSPDQANFNAIIKAHMANPDAPLLLEGTTGLGKTRAYLSAVMQAAESGKRIAIALPSHQLIDQLLASSDLAATAVSGVSVMAFKPAGFFENRKAYTEHKDNVLQAKVMLCTCASVIIDHRLKGGYNGVIDRDYIVFDEADQLPASAALQSDCVITSTQFKEMGIKVETAEQAVRAALAKKEVEPEVKAQALMILEAVQEPAWFHKTGVTDDGGVMLFHQMPGRLLKQVANQSNVAFISATLSIAGSFDDFKRAMGIQTVSKLSNTIEPTKHGKLHFHVSDLEVDTPEWLGIVQKTVDEAMRPTLIVTPSHELAQTLGSVMPNAVVRRSEETTSEAANRMGKADVLIAAGAWAGLDTSVRWASVVVPKIPFEKPVILDGHQESHFLNSRNTAVRRMRQVIGRGLRSPDAECHVYILDGRSKAIESFVPKRFLSQWAEKGFLEGARVEVTLSKLERDPTVRKKALSHYGQDCMACGFKPKHISQIDVHHLFPLSEGGERLTSITDVAVLCATCHRLAHSTKPPMSVEAMKSLNDYF